MHDVPETVVVDGSIDGTMGGGAECQIGIEVDINQLNILAPTTFSISARKLTRYIQSSQK